MSELLKPLIELLADGRFHSGTELGRELDVSRAAIWKTIKKLDELGIEVHSVRGKGYRMPRSLSLLDARSIRAALPEHAHGRLSHLEIHHSIDSTNSFAMRQLQDGALTPQGKDFSVYLAEQQTRGKGRRGRQWVSPFGRNIYLTLVRMVDTGTVGTEGISLVVGLAVLRALRDHDVSGIGVKWPNDVLADGKKLAGILMEITGDLSGVCQLIIGVGVNIDCEADTMKSVTQSWTDLYQHTGREFDRNQLAGSLISHIMTALQDFETHGLNSFVEEWNAFDVMKGSQVEIITSGSSRFGRAAGISENGALVLETEEGVQLVTGGEVSLRSAPEHDS